ncbi:MAG: 1-deoxy-D-xylulose-5-phosphate synthase [Myxococcota bacterium]
MRRIMYIEEKGGEGEPRIGWVEMTRTSRSYRYGGHLFTKVSDGYKYNCVNEAGETCWISGPQRDGTDTLYGAVVAIDEDAREAYWRDIRARPGCMDASFRSGAGTRTGATVRLPRSGSATRR